jgi:hypothetical protein
MSWFANVTIAVILRGLNKVFWVERGTFFPDRLLWSGRNGLAPSYPGWSPGALHYATPALTDNFIACTLGFLSLLYRGARIGFHDDIHFGSSL